MTPVAVSIAAAERSCSLAHPIAASTCLVFRRAVLISKGLTRSSTVFGCLQAQEKTAVPPQTIHVYVHPKKLTVQDRLQDHDTVIEIKARRRSSGWT